MGFANYNRLKSREFVGLSSFHFLVFFRRLLIYTFLSIYLKEKIGLSTTEITLMATLPMIISAAAQSFLWGPWIDRIQRPHLFVIWGEVIAALLHLVLVWLHIYAIENSSLQIAGYTIIGMLMVIEFPWSASNVGLLALIAERTTSKERTRLIGQLSISGGVGAIFGAFVGSIFYDNGVGFSRGMLFYLSAVVMIISAFIIYFTIQDLQNNDEISLSREETLELDDLSANFNIRTQFLPFIIALTLINFGRNGVAIISSLFVANDDSINATDTQIALYRNLESISTLLTGVLIGSRLGKKNDTLIMQIGTVMIIIGLLWLGLAPSYGYILLAAILLGSSNIILQASSYSIATRITPDNQKGKLLGYYNATFFLSWGLAATFFFAPLVDVLVYFDYKLDTAYRVAFIASSIAVCIGLLVLNSFIRKDKDYIKNNKNINLSLE